MCGAGCLGIDLLLHGMADRCRRLVVPRELLERVQHPFHHGRVLGGAADTRNVLQAKIAHRTVYPLAMGIGSRLVRRVAVEARPLIPGVAQQLPGRI